MKTKLRLLAIEVLALGATICMLPAQSKADGDIVTIGGITYDVGTVTEAFTGNQSALEAEPWWGSGFVAEEFASAVAADLGTDSSGIGPSFAYSFSPGEPLPVDIIAWDSSDSVTDAFSAAASTKITYATAIVVNTPEPSTRSLLLLGLLAVGLLVRVNRYRRNRLATSA